MGPGDLKELTGTLPLDSHPDLIVGRESADDAGVVRLSGDLVLIQTLDFFTPVVDDPHTFGAIAAANAMSDVYAMGGKPLTAMNIACFPMGKIDKQVLIRVLEGGYEKIKEAGALLVGGHTVDDSELKYGLSVTGTAHPDDIMTNAAAKAGDRLILTKPLGTGVYTTALKGDKIDPAGLDEAVEWMLMLNDKASACATAAGVRCCTDITGFGLMGHACEMAESSKACLEISAGALPLLHFALQYAREGYCPGGLFRNKKFTSEKIIASGTMDQSTLTLMFDPQTSGGLLLACPETTLPDLEKRFRESSVSYWKIGRVLAEPAGKIIIVD
ncbi:MAG: selenide, water dikinase SelD [Pseudomonadota bacterium]